MNFVNIRMFIKFYNDYSAQHLIYFYFLAFDKRLTKYTPTEPHATHYAIVWPLLNIEYCFVCSL